MRAPPLALGLGGGRAEIALGGRRGRLSSAAVVSKAECGDRAQCHICDVDCQSRPSARSAVRPGSVFTLTTRVWGPYKDPESRCEVLVRY